jgi:hypothetical protein
MAAGKTKARERGPRSRPGFDALGDGTVRSGDNSWVIRERRSVTDPYSAVLLFFDDAKYWRERAKQTRKLAEGIRLPDAKEAMLRLANEYECLARRVEEKSQIENLRTKCE